LRKSCSEFVKSTVDLFESLIDLVESLVDISESLVDLVESLVDISESLVDISESLVDISKSLVDIFLELSDVGPLLFELFLCHQLIKSPVHIFALVFKLKSDAFGLKIVSCLEIILSHGCSGSYRQT